MLSTPATRVVILASSIAVDGIIVGRRLFSVSKPRLERDAET